MSIQSVTAAPPAVVQPPQRASDTATSPISGAIAASGESRPVQPVDAPTAPAATPGNEEILKALDEVREAVKPVAQSLHFSLDQDTGRTVIKVMDTETNEMIRQIPSEDILKIAQAIDKLQGLLIKQEA
ncbi:flagellar protein FlaG [Aromatoleum diolicum]|uniref:Flagellar protein FlaG n=1 Tax=Aromatoleum diolicum TaxID=75796 RepID=A0ABX1QEN7_9RHOO|nr:flagellar protein FlaG [Aromatoleum diolicum]NMG76393.1 hypothetical protein [Aromatoleum diolicum]